MFAKTLRTQLRLGDQKHRSYVLRMAYPFKNKAYCKLCKGGCYKHNVHFYCPCLSPEKLFSLNQQCQVCFCYPCVISQIFDQFHVTNYVCIDQSQARAVKNICYLCYPYCGCCCPCNPCAEKNNRWCYKYCEAPLPLHNQAFVLTGLICSSLVQPCCLGLSCLSFFDRRKRNQSYSKSKAQDSTAVTPLMDFWMAEAISKRLYKNQEFNEDLENHLNEMFNADHTPDEPSMLQQFTEGDDEGNKISLDTFRFYLDETRFHGEDIEKLGILKKEHAIHGMCCFYCWRCAFGRVLYKLNKEYQKKVKEEKEWRKNDHDEEEWKTKAEETRAMNKIFWPHIYEMQHANKNIKMKAPPSLNILR